MLRRSILTPSLRASALTSSRLLSSTAAPAAATTVKGASQTRPGEAPLEPSLTERLGLDKPQVFIPGSAVAAVAMSSTGLYHLNAETQITFIFGVFVYTVYSYGGSAMREFFDEQADAILKAQNEVEDLRIESCKKAIEAHKNQANLHAELSKVLTGQDELLETIAVAQAHQAKHTLRDDIARQLDYMVNLKQKTEAEAHTRLAQDTILAVKNTYKANAAQYAPISFLNALQATAGLSGKDTVAWLNKVKAANPQAEIKSVIAAAEKTAAEQTKGDGKALDLVSGLYFGHLEGVAKDYKQAAGTEIELSKEQQSALQAEIDSYAQREGLKADVKAPTTIQLN